MYLARHPLACVVGRRYRTAGCPNPQRVRIEPPVELQRGQPLRTRCGLRQPAVRILEAGFANAGWLIVVLAAAVQAAKLSEPVHYSGMCDASAAIAVDTEHFVVANDEDNQLRVYRRDTAGSPVQRFNLASVLEIDLKSPEADIEGAARVGNRIYWITSHARNKEGELRLNRHAFFATEFQRVGEKLQMKLVGKPYRGLLRHLTTDQGLSRFRLDAAARLEPKMRGALNIEGLCAAADGQLLIGFRNPVPKGKALLVPLQNPADLTEGKPARFGDPILLDLDGRGVREIVFFEGRYVIVAGSPDGSGRSKLFAWEGDSNSKPKTVPGVDLKGINPEAVVVYSDDGWRRFQLLSDDGGKRRGGTPCKELKESLRRFRAVWVE